MVRLVALWGPVLAFMIAVHVWSDPEDLPSLPGRLDLVAHGAAYGLFGLACLRAFHGGLRTIRLEGGRVLGALALTVGYGIWDEWRQASIPGRYSSVGDGIADGVGALVALAAVWTWSMTGGRANGSATTGPNIGRRTRSS